MKKKKLNSKNPKYNKAEAAKKDKYPGSDKKLIQEVKGVKVWVYTEPRN
jgi:hypothetical protein